MKFFFDHNLSPKLVRGLQAIGEDVIHLTDQFSEDIADEEWLKFIGIGGICLITRDTRIRWRPNEIDAIRQYKVGAFFLGGKNLPQCQIVQQLVRNWPQMKILAAKTHRPFAFIVPPSGTKIRPYIL